MKDSTNTYTVYIYTYYDVTLPESKAIPKGKQSSNHQFSGANMLLNREGNT